LLLSLASKLIPRLYISKSKDSSFGEGTGKPDPTSAKEGTWGTRLIEN
jgi:hypothetical protein